MNKEVLWEKSSIYSEAGCISFQSAMVTNQCQEPSFKPFINNSRGWGKRRGLQSTVKDNLYCAKTRVMLSPEDFGVTYRGRSCWSECFIGGGLGKITEKRTTTHSVLLGGYVWPCKHCINSSGRNGGLGCLHISSATANHSYQCAEKL